MADFQCLIAVPPASAGAAWDIIKTILTKGTREDPARAGWLRNATTKVRTFRAVLLAVGQEQRDTLRTVKNTIASARLFVWDRDEVLRFTDVAAAKQFEDTHWTLEDCLAAQNLERAPDPRPAGM